MVEKDTRPVRCYICKRKMYYAGHPKHTPEYRLNDDNHNFIGYVHKECVENKKLARRRGNKNNE